MFEKYFQHHSMISESFVHCNILNILMPLCRVDIGRPKNVVQGLRGGAFSIRLLNCSIAAVFVNYRGDQNDGQAWCSGHEVFI